MSFEVNRFDSCKHRECSEEPVCLGGGTSVSKVEDRLYEEADVESMTATSDSASTSFPVHLRPILVGYAFGPKKMSTMGIIMAEASKALSTVVTAAVPVCDRSENAHRLGSLAMSEESDDKVRGFSSALSLEDTEDAGTEPSSISSVDTGSSSPVPDAADTIVDNAATGLGGQHKIFRLFRSSNSSAVSVTDSATSGSATTSSLLPSMPSLGKTTQQSAAHRLRPIRVSFVPLDLDSPLEEQHGGNFDAILHKLTEDILCLSKMSTEARSFGTSASPIMENIPYFSDCDLKLSESQVQAVQRVSRLNQYKQCHPQCCLVDHPSNVQILMSRSDIAHFLLECLVGVCSASGIPVGTPRFEIIDSEGVSAKCISNLIDHAPFSYPLIAKPLAAAGTAESHRMAVVLDPNGLELIKTPCLLQEYANHDATLFKVYVLGDTVRVFQRPSLPNLPSSDYFQRVRLHHSSSYVEFDSQQPYPTLSDFGIIEIPTDGDPTACECEKSSPEDQLSRNRKRRRTSPVDITLKKTSCEERSPLRPFVTADEVRPVVDVLKEAFGLELFGFDILVTDCVRHGQSGRTQLEMLVVDVNYFPSYKEVTNFPSLLAQYLTQRAIEGRVNSLNSR